MYVNMHNQPALWQFRNIELWHCYGVARVAFWAEVAFVAEVASALVLSVCVSPVGVHMLLCFSSVSAHSLPWHFGKEAICPCDFDEALLRVFLLQPPLVMPRTPNTLLLLFLDFGARFLDQILHFLYCGTHKPFFGHFGHIQCQAYVGLFQLYTTSLPCHSSRHVENLQEISCCL